MAESVLVDSQEVKQTCPKCSTDMKCIAIKSDHILFKCDACGARERVGRNRAAPVP